MDKHQSMHKTYTQSFLLAVTLRILEKGLLHLLVGPLHLRAVKLLLIGWPLRGSAYLKIMMITIFVGSNQPTWRIICIAAAHSEEY